MKPAQRLELFPEYVFSRLSKIAHEVEHESHRKVLHLAHGIPDVRTSKNYLDAYCKAVMSPTSHLYPPYGATEEFSQALITWYQKRFTVDLDETELYPLLGEKEGLALLPLALLDEKDEILVPNPGYPTFRIPPLFVGAKPVFYDLTEENNFKIDFSELEKKITLKTKYIIVNFPSNPTGQIATLKELSEIVTFAKKRGLFLVYDNAYSEITYDGFVAPSILQIEGAKDIAVELGSFSKTFSFAGFRMGWIVGNKEIIGYLAKVKSQMDSGMSKPLQELGTFALTNFDKQWYNEMINSYQQRRDVVAKHCRTLGLTFTYTKGALYLWAKIPDYEKDSEDYCLKMLKEKHILFTPGTAFGSGGARYVRISFCVNIDNIEEYFPK